MITKYFKRKFLTSGVVGYNDTGDGNLLLKKDVIDKALNTLLKKPVLITHEDMEQVGEVVDCYFSPEEDNFICGFNIWNEEAIDLLDNKGYGISCTYNILREDKQGGIYHNIPYESEAEKIIFVNIAITDKPRYEEAKQVLNSIIENGGAGSGNWGHSGRKGKVGGSSKSQTNEHTKARRAYGRRLRELSEAFKADNIAIEYKKRTKALVEKIKEERKSTKQPTKPEQDLDYLARSGVGFFDKTTQDKIKEVAGKIQVRPEGTYIKGDNKRREKVLEKALEQAKDPNYKPEFETLTTTLRGAKLIKKDGKVAWVKPSFIRKDGSLTAGGLKALKMGLSEIAYNKMQEAKTKKIDIVKDAGKKTKELLKTEYNYNVDDDQSDKPFIDMKKRALLKYDLNPSILQEKFETPDNIQAILQNDPTASFSANYWENPDGSKKRIYFNVENKRGYIYPLTKNYINL